WIVMDGMQEMFFGPREELEAA
ncbi:MAG: hypothetical protein RLZZ196_1756, partial [Bacteroidota bacterium]